MIFTRLFSYQLWRLLYSQVPLRHPYTRLLQREYILIPRKRQWRDWIWILIIGMGIAWLITSGNLGAYIGVLFGMILLVVAGGNLGAILLSIHTIALINAERQKKRVELITITPLGYIGILYSILYIAYKRPRWIKSMISFVNASVVYGVVVVSMFLIYNPLENLPLFILLGVMVFAVYYDTLQSIVLGGIISAYVGSHSLQDRLSAQFSAISLHIFLQAILYGTTGITVHQLNILNQNDMLIMTVIFSLGLGILFSSREIMICILFNKIKQAYGEKPVHLASIYNNL
jgi:hypothetical protein